MFCRDICIVLEFVIYGLNRLDDRHGIGVWIRQQQRYSIKSCLGSGIGANFLKKALQVQQPIQITNENNDTVLVTCCTKVCKFG